MSVNIRNPLTGELTNASGGVINPKSINEMIAPIEDGTASKAYAVGEQFIMNDLLCEATQAIAQGDTMVIGTNCEESEQLSKQVKDINTSLTANGNRFEAGYSSANDEYGFNIGSTFYPIGASSGGGGGSEIQLDFTNVLHDFSTQSGLSWTATRDCYITGTLGYSAQGKITIDNVIIDVVNFSGSHFITPIRVSKGSVITVDTTQTNVYALGYNVVSSEVTVFNEAEVELNYTNPLHTFDSTHLSYTATKTCWLTGVLFTDAVGQNPQILSINGKQIGRIAIWGGSGDCGSQHIPPIKLSVGDVVTVNLMPNDSSLYILEGTISGSVGHLGGALYPDYSRLIANPSGHSYTATKDCFLCGVGFVNGGDIGIFINGHCAFRQGDNLEILLHAGDVVTAGAPSTSYTFKQDGTYYTNSLGVFEIAD